MQTPINGLTGGVQGPTPTPTATVTATATATPTATVTTTSSPTVTSTAQAGGPAANVPTLSGWGLAALVLLLGLAGYFVMRGTTAG
jgi:hypothetical protein